MIDDGERLEMSRDEFMEHMTVFTESHRRTIVSLHKELLYFRIIVLIYTIGAVIWILSSI